MTFKRRYLLFAAIPVAIVVILIGYFLSHRLLVGVVRSETVQRNKDLQDIYNYTVAKSNGSLVTVSVTGSDLINLQSTLEAGNCIVVPGASGGGLVRAWDIKAYSAPGHCFDK